MWNVYYVIFKDSPLCNDEYDVFWSKEKALEWAEIHRDSDYYEIIVNEMKPSDNGSYVFCRELLHFNPSNYE